LIVLNASPRTGVRYCAIRRSLASRSRRFCRIPPWGAIEGIADAAMSAAKVAGGVVADRPGGWKVRRLPAAVALLVSLGHTSFALAYAWPVVAVSRAVPWIARGGKNPSRDSLLAGSVERAELGKAIGLESGHAFGRGGRRPAAGGTGAAGGRLPVAGDQSDPTLTATPRIHRTVGELVLPIVHAGWAPFSDLGSTHPDRLAPRR
jgi:hypothetical protein